MPTYLRRFVPFLFLGLIIVIMALSLIFAFYLLIFTAFLGVAVLTFNWLKKVLGNALIKHGSSNAHSRSAENRSKYNTETYAPTAEQAAMDAKRKRSGRIIDADSWERK